MLVCFLVIGGRVKDLVFVGNLDLFWILVGVDCFFISFVKCWVEGIVVYFRIVFWFCFYGVCKWFGC